MENSIDISGIDWKKYLPFFLGLIGGLLLGFGLGMSVAYQDAGDMAWNQFNTYMNQVGKDTTPIPTYTLNWTDGAWNVTDTTTGR